MTAPKDIYYSNETTIELVSGRGMSRGSEVQGVQDDLPTAMERKKGSDRTTSAGGAEPSRATDPAVS